MMATNDLEHVSFEVPVGQGLLIGNTLRQFAMRGAPTWQIAAYKVGTRQGSYGISGNVGFSCNDLFKGVLVCEDDGEVGAAKIVRFTLDGNRYKSEEGGSTKYIENLGNIGLQSMQVCLVYASGTRTMEQNHEVAKRIFTVDDGGFIAVSSRHTKAITFKFEVKPVSAIKESLFIEATAGVISDARDAAIIALRDLVPTDSN